jgi:hypothetical protein
MNENLFFNNIFLYYINMYYILIIIFIIFILYLYINNKYKEKFQNDSIHVNKDVYVNNNESFDYTNINANKLCIKDHNGTECINKEELFNALELPIFRRHAICIDDACLTVNNLNKINGDENIKLETTDEAYGVRKCMNYGHIPASLSVRKQKMWESDANRIQNKGKVAAERAGIAIGSLLLATFTMGLSLFANIGAKKRAENNNTSVGYDSLYEPKGGWQSTVKDWCRPCHFPKSYCKNGTRYGRKSEHDWRCLGKQKPSLGVAATPSTYGMCQKGYGYHDYDNIEKYGCSAGHKSSGNVCWKSAGQQCNDARAQRKSKFQGAAIDKKFSLIGSEIKTSDADIKSGMPVMDSISCDDEKTDFKIDSGELKKNIPLIEKPVNYYVSNKFPHQVHNKIK